MNTYWVALTSIGRGTLGPLRMSALSHTGLRTFPASVSCCRRSREGPTALRLLKSSLIPVGRRQGLGELEDVTLVAEPAGRVCVMEVREGGKTGQMVAGYEDCLLNRANPEKRSPREQ